MENDDQFGREVFGRISAIEITLAAHMAREELRDEAVKETLDGILTNVQKTNEALLRGKGAVAAGLGILLTVAAVGAWIYEHFSISPR